MIFSDHLDPTLQAALAASAKGDVDEALRLYREVIHAQPALATAHFLLAAELAQAGRLVEAEAAYATAVLLAPDLYIVRFELGALQFTSGRASMALLTWEPLMLLPDAHALKLFVQAYAALAQDHFEPALALFRQGMAANTDNAALNGNIELLVSAIEKTKVGAGAASRPSGMLPVAAEGPSESEVQFLLSAYQRGQGPLH